ncbi:battenin CLN3 protein [Tieghemiomyces parasiticus]|uniref:Protein BTN n=1 Tax=Tieghemiomyces parasiticus TaxID=78921 RepID=A0A9W8A6Z3_9FUNG|nr:battenin CLN3 protein [Tieghemiomyces parasiticus]
MSSDIPYDHSGKLPVTWAISIAFFVCGVVNNFVYSIFLSAAERILETSQNMPGIILVASIVPSTVLNIVAPYFVHRIPYHFRIITVVLSLIASLHIVAWVDHVAIRIAGVALCSLGSGLGELSLLMFSSFYHSSSVSAWSSGTGGAGLLGSFSFLALTVWARLSLTTALSMVSVLPLLMAVVYFVVLRIPGPLMARQKAVMKSASLDPRSMDSDSDAGLGVVDQPALTKSSTGVTTTAIMTTAAEIPPEERPLSARIRLLRPLLMPYILPLFFVYWAEYTINSGVNPTNLFPLDRTPFQNLSDHYIYYQAIYQLGVFISRSSVRVFHIQRVWVPSALQIVTLGVFLSHALVPWIPSVWVIFVLIFWEGLLGGSTYVNAYYNVSKDVAPVYREFSMGVCGLGSSVGISLASFTAIGLQVALCNFQVDHGRTLCQKK